MTVSARRCGPQAPSRSAQSFTTPWKRCAVDPGAARNYALLLLALAVALFIAVKWRQRRRFLMQIRMARLSPAELDALMREQTALTILDVRSAERRTHTGWIPGVSTLRTSMSSRSMQRGKSSSIATVRTTPALRSRAPSEGEGLYAVRPLAGGFDAWRLEGRRVDRGEASPEGAFAQIGATRSKAAPVG